VLHFDARCDVTAPCADADVLCRAREPERTRRTAVGPFGAFAGCLLMKATTRETSHSREGGAAEVRREPPTTRELMERRKQQQEDARTAWHEYEQRQREVDANMARLRAQRLAREKAAAEPA
jgi:hypothetical protein